MNAKLMHPRRVYRVHVYPHYFVVLAPTKAKAMEKVKALAAEASVSLDIGGPGYTRIPSCEPEKYHDTVGVYFRGPDGATFLCTSYVSKWGFWMEAVEGTPGYASLTPDNRRRNVSERAPGRTFHRDHELTPEVS